jgi:hypothetical protein
MPRTGSGSARRSAARPGPKVKDKLKALHSELDAGVRTAAGYTVDMAVTGWLAEGLPGPGRQDGRCAPPSRYGARADPAAGPDRAGRPDRAGDDGGHPFHADAAEGAQLPDAGAEAR